MKKLQFLVCVLPLFASLLAARAEVPAPTTDPAASSPAAPDSSAAVSDTSSQVVDPVKEAEIRKLLELTGAVKMMNQVMDQMISSFKKQNSGVSTQFWDRFEKEMNIQDLLNKMIPIYAKYYTLDDLKTVNAFYQTPTGQRMLAATPQIMRESMQIGQDWGRRVATNLMVELKEEKQKASSSESSPTAQ